MCDSDSPQPMSSMEFWDYTMELECMEGNDGGYPKITVCVSCILSSYSWNVSEFATRPKNECAATKNVPGQINPLEITHLQMKHVSV